MKTIIDRIVWPDLLKCFAIFTVIVGHVASVYDPRGYSSPICMWIYSFHMPLFMMLSGMFFKYAIKKDFKLLLCDKSRTLLLPLITWGLLLLLIEVLPFVDYAYGDALIDYFKRGGPLRGYWYLKCLFGYIIVNYILFKLFNRLWIASIISILIFLILPNINFSKMMIVFFWTGVFYERLSESISKAKVVVFSLISMIFCYVFLDIKANYLQEFSWGNYIQFLLTGLSASLFWLSLFELMSPNYINNMVIRILQQIGTLSLGIYCIHELFYFKKLYYPVFEHFPKDSIIVQLIYSLVVFLLSYLFVNLIQKNKYTSFLLLGRKLTKK